MSTAELGLRTILLSVVVNLSLALIKIATGLVGNSYALIADGVESTADVASSLVIFGGLRIGVRPPDETHPYGHGKAESVAGAAAALGLLIAAGLIAGKSVHEIRNPHLAPEWYTLPVLVLVIAVKELLARRILKVGRAIASTSLRVDAWHHRSDALTSSAVLIGIAIALVGGPGLESADDWAALLACGVIVVNAVLLLHSAAGEIMDAAVPSEIQEDIRTIASRIRGVQGVEKLRVRKSGLGYLMDIHVEVDGGMTVTESHAIAHRVKDHLLQSDLGIRDVVVHIEPTETVHRTVKTRG